MLNRKILRRRRTWLIASAAVALCTATAVLTGALPASAASQPAARSTVRTVVARVSRLPALPAGVKPAATLPLTCGGARGFESLDLLHAMQVPEVRDGRARSGVESLTCADDLSRSR